MGELMQAIRARTKTSQGRIWDSEPYIQAMHQASLKAADKSKTVKYAGLMVVVVPSLIIGPLAALILGGIWVLVGFRCVDAYYAGWLEGNIKHLTKEAETGQRLAALCQRSSHAAELLRAARQELNGVMSLHKAGRKDVAATALMSAFCKAMAASYTLRMGTPPEPAILSYEEEIEYKRNAGFTEDDEYLMIRLSLLPLSQKERESIGMFSMLPLHVLVGDVEQVIERVERGSV